MKSGIARRVAVFGGGVAGLTAAHELIERGFRVRVYEPTPPGPGETICGVGGMARTQFSRVEIGHEEIERGRIPSPSPGHDETFVRSQPLPEGRAEFLELRIPFSPGSAALGDEARKMLRTTARPFLDRSALKAVWIRGHDDDVTLGPDLETLWREPAAKRLDLERARAVARYLEPRRRKAKTKGCGLWPVAIGYGFPDDPTRPAADRCYVSFQIAEDLLPGEHGFRFFPSFYRHIFDTMDRIPLARDPAGPLVESGRTVRDNLVSTTSQGIAYDGEGLFTVPRRLPRTMRELLDATRRSLHDSGITGSDAGLLGLKILRYATSCAARRERTYEHQSWWDFLEGWRYSPRCQKYLDSSPQMLVAMRAKQSDARTIGNITVQLMLDQLRHGENTDRTLRGPTTTAWLAPWRRYLERQGVEFVQGRLLRYENGGGAGVAIVAEPARRFDPPARWVEKPIELDYYVVAVSAEAARALVRAGGFDGCAECGKIAALDLGRPDRANPGGLCDHMSGIQLYFRSEISFVAGHTIYPDSEWGLSSIAQPQFWTSRRGWWDGYRGLLSIDIGNWHARSDHTGKTAWQSTADQIAHEVWRQVADDPLAGVVPEKPIFYHIDENIVFGPDGTPAFNRTPMLINRTGTYRQRAGSPGNYHLHDGQLVFAGTHMQTHTRLTTMEAANESARHAVRAILEREHFRGDRPMIESPEDHEIEDLGWLVAIDERLFHDGMPHLFDIVGEQSLLDPMALLPDLLRRAVDGLPLDPGQPAFGLSRGRRRSTA
jgi:hypothetical protein